MIFIQNVKKNFFFGRKIISFFFFKVFNQTLEQDIRDNTTGHLKKILLTLVHNHRPESNQINEEQIENDAKNLYNAGDNKWGTDESKFIQILCNRRLIIHLLIIFLIHILLVMFN